MRSLRSRTVGNTSNASETSVTKSLTKISKKKTKSLKTKLSPSKASTDSLDNEVFESPKSSSNEDTKPVAKIGRKTRNIKRRSYETTSTFESNDTNFNKTVGYMEVEKINVSSKKESKKKNKQNTAFESIIKKTREEIDLVNKELLETALNECLKDTRKSKINRNKKIDENLVKSSKKKLKSTSTKRSTFDVNDETIVLNGIKNRTFDSNDDNQQKNIDRMNSTLDANSETTKNRKSVSIKNTTFDADNENKLSKSKISKSVNNINTTFDSNEELKPNLRSKSSTNLSFVTNNESKTEKHAGKRKSIKYNTTFESNEGLKQNRRSKSTTNLTFGSNNKSITEKQSETRKSIKNNTTFHSNDGLKQSRHSKSATNLTFDQNNDSKSDQLQENQISHKNNTTFDSNDGSKTKCKSNSNKNTTFDTNDDNKLSEKQNSIKYNISEANSSQKEFMLPDVNFSMNLENEIMPELLKMDTSTSSDERNKTLTYDQDCIVIDDSIDISKKLETNTTFEKNTTFDKNKSQNDINKTNRRETFNVQNGSGEWSIKLISESPLNDSDHITLHKKRRSKSTNDPDHIFLHKKRKSSDNFNQNDSDHITLHKKRKTKSLDRSKLSDSDPDHITLHKHKTLLNETIDTPTKSLRKKWVKFQNEPETQSPILRKSSFYDTRTAKSLFSSTPFDKKYPLTPAKLNKSALKNTSIIENKSTSKSVKKSALKAKAMPNFALIHQKANEKIESIKDYSERKQQRAVKLLSGEKPENSKENHKTHVVKSSEELFGNIQADNKTPEKEKTPKKIVKPKVFVSKLPQFSVKSVLSTNQDVNKSRTESGNSKKNKFTLESSKTKTKPVVIVKPTEKPVFPKKEVSVFSKGHLLAIANKTKTKEGLGNRDNRRDQLKGVRTNRRFDLLMKMRNNN